MCMVFLRRRSSMDASLYCAGKDSDMSQWSRNGPAHTQTWKSILNLYVYNYIIYIYICSNIYIYMTDYIT